MICITVGSPNGGEVFAGGSTQTIRWTSKGVSNVSIYLYKDWMLTDYIATNLSATQQSYDWKVPVNIDSKDWKIRIRDAAHFNVWGESDSFFEVISPRMISLISPRKNATVISNRTYNITWKPQKVNKVNIDYSVDQGAHWISIIKNINASPGKYQWQVPDTTEFSCEIRISDAFDPSLYSANIGYFRIIKVKVLHLLSPEDSGKVTAGSIYPIRWDEANLGKVNISCSLNYGVDWTYIAKNINPETEMYNWSVPDTEAPRCKIRITEVADSEVYSENLGTFMIRRIKPGSLSLTSPQGGEILKAGSPFDIKWAAQNIDNVNISYTTDAGRNWSLISSNANGAFQRYTWTVPAIYSDSCRIRIVDADDTSYHDESRNFFRIESAAGIEPRIAKNPFSADLTLYPDPVTDRIHISLENPFDRPQLFISGLDGRLVYSAAFGSSVKEIQLNLASRLKAGVYFLKISDGQRTATGKFEVCP
jgi:hypothetical protein